MNKMIVMVISLLQVLDEHWYNLVQSWICQEGQHFSIILIDILESNNLTFLHV